jgi:cyclophilin family peptidyl-prolyl cis-trans isomerase
MKFDILSLIIIVLIVILGTSIYNNELKKKNNIVINKNQLDNTKQITNINPINNTNPINNIKKIDIQKHKKSNIKKTKDKHKKKVRFDILNDKDNNINNINDKPMIFFDIGCNNKYYGKIIIKLFYNIVPKTCYNFMKLCETKKYVNSPFHRIIKDFMIQGGDYTNMNGTGGLSVYGHKFQDENFKLNHDKPYLLSMANSGPNTNNSQFFITTTETPHLNGKHVVFGEIYNGFDIIDKLNLVQTDNSDKPIQFIKILNCGLINK